MSQPANPTPSRLLPALLLLGLIALGGLLAYAALRPPPDTLAPAPEDAAPDLLDPQRIAFLPAPIDAAALERARAHLTTGPLPAPELRDPLLARFHELNRLEATRASEPTRRPVETALAIRVRELLGVAGKPGLYTFIEHTLPDFRAALQTLHQRAAQQPLPIEELIQAPPDDLLPAVQWAGGFVLLARSVGLMDPQGAIAPRLAPLVDLLYRYRWYTTLTGSADPRELLTRDEYRLLVRWRLQEAQNLPIQQRLRYIHEAATLDPDFPAPAAEGVLLTQDNNIAAARERFAEQATLRPDLAPLMDRYLQLLDATPEKSLDSPGTKH